MIVYKAKIAKPREKNNHNKNPFLKTPLKSNNNRPKCQSGLRHPDMKCVEVSTDIPPKPQAYNINPYKQTSDLQSSQSFYFRFGGSAPFIFAFARIELIYDVQGQTAIIILLPLINRDTESVH